MRGARHRARSSSYLRSERSRGAVEEECTTEDEQDTRDAVVQVQVHPGSELLAQAGWGRAARTNTARLAGRMQLGHAQLVDALPEDELVVAAEVGEPAANGTAKEVIRAERVQAHVPTHGHELRAGQIVESEVIVEKLRNVDDVFGGWTLASNANLGSVS